MSSLPDSPQPPENDSSVEFDSLSGSPPGAANTPELRKAQAAAGYQLLSSRQVYRNPWTAVREDILLHPNGHRGLYGIVERGTFAVILPRHRDGKLTLVRQFRYPVGKRLWEFPMGMWEDRPGVDPHELALGELREETGLQAGRLVHAGCLWQGAGYSTQKGHVYLACDLERGPQALEATEADLVCRDMTLDTFQRMMREGEITCMVTLAAFALINAKGLL